MANQKRDENLHTPAWVLRILYYEAKQLLGAFRLWMKEKEAQDKVLKNALIETCLLHIRALDDFFAANKGHKTDLKLRDIDVRAEEKVLLDPDDHDRIDKFLAHMTEKRVEWLRDGGPAWDLERVVPMCLSTCANTLDRYGSKFPTPTRAGEPDREDCAAFVRDIGIQFPGVLPKGFPLGFCRKRMEGGSDPNIDQNPPEIDNCAATPP